MSYPKITASNSTTACEHFKQAKAVEQACNQLLAALEAATPKTIDYAPIGPDAHWRAANAHRGRILAVQGIRGHVRCLAQHVSDQLQAVEQSAAKTVAA